MSVLRFDNVSKSFWTGKQRKVPAGVRLPVAHRSGAQRKIVC